MKSIVVKEVCYIHLIRLALVSHFFNLRSKIYYRVYGYYIYGYYIL